jgi:DNA-directed RNA polymerase alpha subunit
MNPKLEKLYEDAGVCHFTLSGVNVSLANAIRRTILSDIPTLAIFTENHKENQCTIYTNTTRLHNEILKQRLSCIPIHMIEHDVLPGNYTLELDVENDTEEMIIVTTEDFRIRNKTTEKFLTRDEARKIFPPSPKTNMFIDFARLRPRIGDSILGEKLKFSAEFSVHTAKENSMFNVVSKCAYANTPDLEKAKLVWEDIETNLRTKDTPADDIEIQRKNFYLLDAQRHFVEDSYDFVLQSVGVFENKDLVKKACVVLQKKMIQMIESLDSDLVPILNAETTMEFCFDVILENEDYTIGKILEYLLYESHYQGDKIFTFCGFKKFHPHNDDSTIRVAYVQNTDKRMVAQHIRAACVTAGDMIKKIHDLFA